MLSVNTGPPVTLTLAFDSGWMTTSIGSASCVAGFRLPSDLVASVEGARLVLAGTNTPVPGFDDWVPNAVSASEIEDIKTSQTGNDWYAFSTDAFGVSGGDLADFQIDVTCQDGVTIEDVLTRFRTVGTARVFSDEADSSGVPLGTQAGLVNVNLPDSPSIDLRLQANPFKSHLVQAFDECDTSSSTVTTLPNGLLGCGGGELDGTPFHKGRLIVRSRVSPFLRPNIILVLKSSRTQAKRDDPGHVPPLAGKDVALRLTLRITETTGTLLIAGSPMTFADQQVTCPAITVGPKGNVVQKINLSSCLTDDMSTLPITALANATNKQIVSAAVIDANTGLAIAVPGVRKRP